MRILLTLFLISACSCRSLWLFGLPEGELKTPQVVSAASEKDKELQWLGDELRHPIKVRVAQAFFTGNDLQIKVHLRVKAELPAQDVVVEVRGLVDGELKEAQYQQLSELIDTPLLRPGQLIVIPFTLQAQTLSEYQIRASWGEDAHEVVRAQDSESSELNRKLNRNLKEKLKGELNTVDSLFRDDTEEALSREISIPPVNPIDDDSQRAADTVHGLRLERVEVEQEELACERPPCDLLYTLSAELVNASHLSRRGASLALGLYWANEGMIPKVPTAQEPLRATEEKVSLDRLLLGPGERQTLRVRIDRAVPQVTGGRFIPHFRVLPEL